MLSLYKLEVFVAVVETGSFSAAAQRLFVSQPAVSQHIQNLETGLGVTLFIRGRGGVRLTPTGDTLYAYARRIVHMLAEAESAVLNIAALKEGLVRVGATPGINVYLLPHWFQQFQLRYPALGVTLATDVTTEVIAGVMERGLDMGFVEGELEGITRRGMGIVSLMPIDLTVIVGRDHPWHEQTHLSIHALHNQPFIMRQPHSRTRIWLDRILAQYGVQPHVVAEFDAPETIKQAVMGGMGAAILPEYATEQERQNGILKSLIIDEVPLRRYVKMIWNAYTPFTPIARALLAHLAEEFPQVAQLIRPTALT